MFLENNRQEIIRILRPYRLSLEEIIVFDSLNTYIGQVKRCLSIIKKKFSVIDANGKILYDIKESLATFGTFHIVISGMMMFAGD